MKLYIFGASGSGVTTLGKTLAEKLGFSYLDSDDYLWEKTDPPYTIKRDKVERNALLTEDIRSHSPVILGGSVVSWGLECLCEFDLAIFLYLPTNIRLERLKEREENRFGNRLVFDPIIIQNYSGLIEWASGYDLDAQCGRGFPIHQRWIDNAQCPVLELRDNISVEDRVAAVISKIGELVLG